MKNLINDDIDLSSSDDESDNDENLDCILEVLKTSK